MPKSKKVRKKYSAKRASQKRDILAVRMEHDTRWTVDGHEYATASILVPAGSIYLPKGFYTKRWIALNGQSDLHAQALDAIKAREFRWQITMWTLAKPPTGDCYRPEYVFETSDGIRIEELDELAARYKQESYDSINPQHFVAQGWTAETIANNNK